MIDYFELTYVENDKSPLQDIAEFLTILWAISFGTENISTKNDPNFCKTLKMFVIFLVFPASDNLLYVLIIENLFSVLILSYTQILANGMVFNNSMSPILALFLINLEFFRIIDIDLSFCDSFGRK